jgi:hypothetical protein
MQDTLTRYLNGIPSISERYNLRLILAPLFDRFSTQSLSSAGLAIKAGASAIVKTGAAAYYGIAQGVLVTKAAATDMAALVGTVTNAKFNVFCFYIDSAGALTSQMGTEGATLATVVMPTPPVGKAQLGFIVVNPTGTGNFVGGTTALDDATVVPNVAYVNTQGPFDPTVLV